MDPMFACAILGLLHHSSDPRFAQQNPRMVGIRTLRLTYIYMSGHLVQQVVSDNIWPCQQTILTAIHTYYKYIPWDLWCSKITVFRVYYKCESYPLK